MLTAAQVVADWTDALSEAPAEQTATVAYGTASATGRYLSRGNDLATEDTGRAAGERSVITVPMVTPAGVPVFSGSNLPPPGGRVTVAGTDRRILSRRIRGGALLDLTIGDVFA